MTLSFCCEPFKTACSEGIISKPKEGYYDHEGLDMNKFYLFDRDCFATDVRTPIKYCPYCMNPVIYKQERVGKVLE